MTTLRVSQLDASSVPDGKLLGTVGGVWGPVDPPADVDPTGGGTGATYNFYEQEVDQGAGMVSVVFDPTSAVVVQSIIVFINGVKQRRDTDWTYDATAHQIHIPAVEGDWVSVNYATET